MDARFSKALMPWLKERAVLHGNLSDGNASSSLCFTHSVCLVSLFGHTHFLVRVRSYFEGGILYCEMETTNKEAASLCGQDIVYHNTQAICWLIRARLDRAQRISSSEKNRWPEGLVLNTYNVNHTPNTPTFSILYHDMIFSCL